MTKQVRDWQKDTELLQKKPRYTMDEVNHIIYNVAPYWLQEYAAEKERADKLEERNKALISAVTADANGTFRCVEEARSEAAETREKKLREAIETAIKEKAVWGGCRKCS